ncbi:MAG: hypothetical protein K2P42_00275 [Lachnospiraceae bacterium]|nr:hypothetical protein [Lachnospiraceae bacterium]
MIELYKKAFHLEVDRQGKDEKTNFIYHTEARIGNQRIRLSDGGAGKEIQADSFNMEAKKSGLLPFCNNSVKMRLRKG